MTQIGLGNEFLYGHVNGNRIQIANNVEQICAFIMKYQTESVVITNILDMLEIETSMGFIMKCTDQEFLRTQIIPTLVPMQMREVNPPEFYPYVTEGERMIDNVRFKTAAGHCLYTLDFSEGFPGPYERLSGYFPSEGKVEQVYPDSISFGDAIQQAREKGWLEE
ncbi:hypothetical protein ACFVS2_25625 [Brevibacillus sp. NPDC058079]|uniref:hypothetical protein n=1 Tax=Brevibacillus sp. NPDC058079 TaxID=3346330 RepID=UPI0036EDC211